MLLAYYIAAIHIEEAFHGRRGADAPYQPFEGIVLTDTFNLHTDRTGFPRDWLPDNSERRRTPAAPADPGRHRESPVVGGAEKLGGRQPERRLPGAGEAGQRDLGRPLDRDLEEQPLRHVQDGDPLGFGIVSANRG